MALPLHIFEESTAADKSYKEFLQELPINTIGSSDTLNTSLAPERCFCRPLAAFSPCAELRCLDLDDRVSVAPGDGF